MTLSTCVTHTQEQDSWWRLIFLIALSITATKNSGPNIPHNSVNARNHIFCCSTVPSINIETFYDLLYILHKFSQCVSWIVFFKSINAMNSILFCFSQNLVLIHVSDFSLGFCQTLSTSMAPRPKVTLASSRNFFKGFCLLFLVYIVALLLVS